MNDKNKSVVYITDENYAMPTCISILSFILHCREDDEVTFYVLTDGVSAVSKQKLKELERRNCTIHLIEASREQFGEVPQSLVDNNIHVSASALFKLKLPDIIAEDFVLYLDSDTIVNGSLNGLFQIMMDNAYVAAVDDMGDFLDEDGNSALSSRIGKKGYSYFNSGVMLLNLSKMRADDISEKLTHYRFTGINYFMDQDAFNFTLCAKRKKLPFAYNFRTPIFDVKTFDEVNQYYFGCRYQSAAECIYDQKILHLTDKMKPWKYNIPWFTDIFLKYYSRSPYRDVPLDLLSPLKPLNDELVFLRHELAEAQKYKEWTLPKELIPKNCRLVLYGAGDVGQDFCRQIVESGHCRIVLWADKHFEGKKDVQSPERIPETDFDYVLIAIQKKEYVKEATKELQMLGIDPECILKPFAGGHPRERAL